MPPRVLLIGGHGKIAQALTPHLLLRSWDVTSLIRTSAQKPTVDALGEGLEGKLKVVVQSLEDVKSTEDAAAIINFARPDWIVWSAGAGGKGGPSRTQAIDREACVHFLQATLKDPLVTKFLLVSYLGSRRNKPSWWTDEQWASAQKINQTTLAGYYEAKLASDEYLTSVSKARGHGFEGICLRPGSLTDGEVQGVDLGQTRGGGKVSRRSVAVCAVSLLENGYEGGWVDLLDGHEEIAAAVERVVTKHVDCFDGEDPKDLPVLI